MKSNSSNLLPRLLRLVQCGLVVSVALATVAQADDKIKVGIPVPLSGPSAQFAEPILKGAQMYADEINAKGGVLGKQIEIIARDSKAKPDEAVRVARDMVARDKVNFLVGTFTSAEGPAVSEVAKELKTVFLALGPKTDQLTVPEKLHPYVFRISAAARSEARAAAHLMSSWKIKKVATMAPDFAYGKDSVKVFIEALKKERPDIEIVDSQWPKLTEADHSPFITAQMATKPDAVFSVICCGQFPSFAKQANALGYFKALNNNFVGVAEAGALETLRALGKEYPLGIWGNAPDAVNFVQLDPNTAKAHAEFTAKVKAYSKMDPPPSWMINGYLGMQFLVEAIKKANSIEADKVAAALLGMELSTPMGRLTMRAKDHQLTRGLVWGKASASKDPLMPVLWPNQYIDTTNMMDP